MSSMTAASIPVTVCCFAKASIMCDAYFSSLRGSVWTSISVSSCLARIVVGLRGGLEKLVQPHIRAEAGIEASHPPTDPMSIPDLCWLVICLVHDPARRFVDVCHSVAFRNLCHHCESCACHPNTAWIPSGFYILLSGMQPHLSSPTSIVCSMMQCKRRLINKRIASHTLTAITADDLEGM